MSRDNLQYIHDDTYGPAVHRSAISLSADNLWSCTRAQKLNQTLCELHQAASWHYPEICQYYSILFARFYIYILTQVLWRPTGVFD